MSYEDLAFERWLGGTMKAFDRKTEGVKARLAVDIYADDLERLKAVAKDRGMRYSQLTREIIRDYFRE